MAKDEWVTQNTYLNHRIIPLNMADNPATGLVFFARIHGWIHPIDNSDKNHQQKPSFFFGVQLVAFTTWGTTLRSALWVHCDWSTSAIRKLLPPGPRNKLGVQSRRCCPRWSSRCLGSNVGKPKFGMENGTFGHIFAWVNYKTYKKNVCFKLLRFPQKKTNLQLVVFFQPSRWVSLHEGKYGGFTIKKLFFLHME